MPKTRKKRERTFTLRNGDQLLIDGVLHRVVRPKGRGDRLALAIPPGVTVKRIPRSAIDKTLPIVQQSLASLPSDKPV